MQPQYQTLEERNKALSQIYSPAVENINQQITNLPSLYQGQRESLQQAKENAFRDITKSASRGGMFFTGFTPREQGRYLGERYLPGLTNLASQENTARLGLLGQLANIQGQQRTAGLSYADQLAAWQRADYLAAQQAAATRAAGAGFSIPDLNIPPAGEDTTATTPTPGSLLSDKVKTNLANDAAQVIATRNRAVIKQQLDYIKNTLTKPNLNAMTKMQLEYKQQALNAAAEASGINLESYGAAPSRFTTYKENPVVQAANVPLSVGRAIQQGYNWIFGSR